MTKKTVVSMITAVAHDNKLGDNGELPWERMVTDMKHFMDKTKGNILIVGRKTFESFNGALPDRINVVISRDPELNANGYKDFPGVCVFPSVESAIIWLTEEYQGTEIIIGGGGEIYKSSLHLVERLYLIHYFLLMS